MRFINTDRYSATHIDWHKFIYAGRKPDNMHRRNYSWQFIQILTVLCATLSALVKKGVVISRVGTEARPYNVAGVWVIKAAHKVENVASLDAQELSSKVAEIESKLQDVSGSGTPVLSAHWVQRRDAMWAGFAPADGQLLKRADYPDAWAAIEAGKVPVTTDAIWLAAASNRGGFSTGDGSTTFRVPDYNGKSSGSLGAAFLRGDGLNSAGTGGVIQGDAIRNITGSFGGSNATPFHSVDARHTNGAMKTVGVTTSFRAAFEPSSAGAAVLFDASKVVPTAADNHPVNVTGCWAVKLFGAEVNPGLVNVTALQDRITELENKHYFYGHKFTPIAIASNSNTLLKVTNVQASNGITLHANKDSVTVSKAGLYKLSYSYALEPQGYPQNTTLTVSITGQPSDTVAYSYIPANTGTNSAMSPANWSGVYKLNAGDNISFKVSTVNGTQASVWWTGTFHVEEI